MPGLWVWSPVRACAKRQGFSLTLMFLSLSLSLAFSLASIKEKIKKNKSKKKINPHFYGLLTFEEGGENI